ncbi:MAG: PH domain-containing protein [Dermatophilaceae bacterium]
MGAPDAPAGPGSGWQRLHPLSPLLRGGVIAVAALGYLATQVMDRVVGSVAPAIGDGPIDDLDDTVPGIPDEVFDRPLLAGGALVAFVAVVALVVWVSWRFSQFRISSGQVELRTGVLFRQHRQVPVERVQTVELSRPVLARLMGLARVVVQSAGGSDSELTLAFLSATRADAVRDHLLDLAGRSDEQWADDEGRADAEPVRAAPEVAGAAPTPWTAPSSADEPLVTVPNGRLFAATILHGSTLVLGAAAALLGLGLGVDRFGVIAFGSVPALVPAVLGIAVSRVRELLVHGNFTLTAGPAALRVRHGLTDLRTAAIPLHRVQAVEILQPRWWRHFGWWRIRVNVAGVEGGQDQSNGHTTLLPVGTLDDALAVLARLGARPDDRRLHQALTGLGGEPGWVGSSSRARWLGPLVWRRIGYALGSRAIVIRSGVLTRRAVVVPHARVQSLALSQGPLERRLGIANAIVVSTPGPVTARVPNLDQLDAERFLVEVAARARTARRGGPSHDPPQVRPVPVGNDRARTPLAPDRPWLVD